MKYKLQYFSEDYLKQGWNKKERITEFEKAIQLIVNDFKLTLKKHLKN